MRYSHLSIIILLSALLGMIWFAIQHGYIVLRMPLKPYLFVGEKEHGMRHKVRIFYYKDGIWASEQRDVVWHEEQSAKNGETLCRLYWSFLEEEGLVPAHTSVQLVTEAATGQELICSLSQTPFFAEQSTYRSWMIMEGFLHTLREHLPSLQQVRLCMQHQPCDDEHLYCLQSWPLEGFLKGVQQEQLSRFRLRATGDSFTIMLDPAGDVRRVGRTIGDAFERTISLRFMEALKASLEKRSPSVRVIITRATGDRVTPLQHASFANRSKVDLYIQCGVFRSLLPQPELYCYTFRSHATTDAWQRHDAALSFIPYQHAHYMNCCMSTAYGQFICRHLREAQATGFMVHSCSALPYRPLIGIQAPAIGVEFGLQDAHQIEQMIEPLVDSIMQALLG